MIKLKPLIKKSINEELKLDPSINQEVEKFVKYIINKKILNSYHRDLTGGDMNPEDFVDDLTHKIVISIYDWVQTVNNRNNWENQPYMIK